MAVVRWEQALGRVGGSDQLGADPGERVGVVSWEQVLGAQWSGEHMSHLRGRCSSGPLNRSHLGMWVQFCQIF